MQRLRETFVGKKQTPRISQIIAHAHKRTLPYGGIQITHRLPYMVKRPTTTAHIHILSIRPIESGISYHHLLAGNHVAHH